ncbi:uncharacterized protein ARMOST_07086 [Armillaria ostoyae]|uniref:Uncharacterized protein n=3 Tax=Physalacriaceae TaxID=862241 RepID=A0A284R4T2_ARMOS|nr:uncharacterized protein ARMOST_07086 [Armillaria ostoyae]
MSAPETATKFAPTQSSSVLGGQIVGRSERQAAPPAALKLRLDLNLEVEIAIQAKVNGDITLSLLEHVGVVLECAGDVGRKTSVMMGGGDASECIVLLRSVAFQSIFDRELSRVPMS